MEIRNKKYISVGAFVVAFAALINFNGNNDIFTRKNISEHRKLLNGYDDTLASLPSYTSNFASVWEQPIQPTDQAIFWYIGLAGGQTFTNIAAKCLGLVQCSPRGDSNGTEIPVAPPVQVVVHADDGAPYLNLNTATPEGLDQVAALGVVQNHQADLIVTPLLTHASGLFDANHKGRVFALFRHPVKRIVDQFYYRQAATWDPYFDPNLATMSIDDFAVSDLVDDNVLVRYLVGITNTTDVTPDQLQTAKDILREKVIVGIQEWLEASVVRFEQFFGWWEKYNVASNPDVNQCHSDEVEAMPTYPSIISGGETWQTLSVRNWADLELYAYAKRLFTLQNALISVPAS